MQSSVRSLGSMSGPQSVVDQVADEVLRLILSGELAPGMPVAIQTLSERLQVSSIPVREALRTLEGRGLITFQRGRRPRVSPVRVEDFEDIFGRRVSIEGDAAARGGHDPELFPRLDEALETFHRHLGHGDTLAIYRAHADFHSLILPAATRWERRFLNELWMASERYIQLYLTSVDTHESVDFVYQLHVELAKTAKSGDAEAVRDAVIEHINHSHRLIEKAVRAASADDD